MSLLVPAGVVRRDDEYVVWLYVCEECGSLSRCTAPLTTVAQREPEASP